MDVLALIGSPADSLGPVFAVAAGEEAAGFQINLFWIVVQAATFLLFLVILWLTAFKRIGSVLEERRSRIEEGLRDADAARVEREQAAGERLATLAAAREEANEVLTRAQRVSDEIREREVIATRAEIERLRDQAAADINAEKERALSEVRSEVADLALLAAGRVVGETMNQDRERRLVEEFLAEMTTDGGARREGRN
ncbi:F0F1 ATP synthase subunit B [soil metagenome]